MGTLLTQVTDADIADGDTISTSGVMASGFDHDDLPSDVFCDKPALPATADFSFFQSCIRF